VQVTQTPDNQLKLNIPNDISFATNSAAIEPRLRPILDQFAQGLGQQPGMEVTIVGHTDSTGNDAINNPLSLARGSVRDYLAGRGVPRTRFAPKAAARASRSPATPPRPGARRTAGSRSTWPSAPRRPRRPRRRRPTTPRSASRRAEGRCRGRTP
jgi:outer membrane protein OmpA-like peptidoglycan-associated protein